MAAGLLDSRRLTADCRIFSRQVFGFAANSAENDKKKDAHVTERAATRCRVRESGG